MTIISARGGDFAGTQVENTIRAVPLEDQSAVFLDRATPTYTAVMDGNGDVKAAVADMALYETALPPHLGRREVRDQLAQTDTLIIDANLPGDAIARAIGETSAKAHVVALAISAAKAARLIESAKRIDLVFMNRREMGAIAGSDDPVALRDLGFKEAVITDGPNAVIILERGSIAHVDVAPATHIVDVTGAGDALAGVTLAARLKNPTRSLRDAVAIGTHASAVALRTTKSMPSLDWDDVLRKANLHET